MEKEESEDISFSFETRKYELAHLNSEFYPGRSQRTLIWLLLNLFSPVQMELLIRLQYKFSKKNILQQQVSFLKKDWFCLLTYVIHNT